MQDAHVLCIDDDVDQLAFLRRLLGRLDGVRVSVAESGAAALAAAATDPPAVIVLDLDLPDTTGEALYSQFQAVIPGTRRPVVVLTGDRSPQRRAGLEALGVAAYHTKPADWGQLTADVIRLVQVATPSQDAPKST